MRDFTIELTHRPGELARITNALSVKGVNLKAVAAMTVANQALLRIIPDDVDTARTALQQANVPFHENDIVVVPLENRAGQLTDVAIQLSDAGVNLQAVYLVGTTDDFIQLAIAADDVEKVKKVLQ